MRSYAMGLAKAPRLALALSALAYAAICMGADLRTTSFNARLKINANRTLTVDETIQLVPAGPTNGLILAEAPQGGHKTQYLVTASTFTSGKTESPLTVTPQGNTLVANLPKTPAGSPIQIHLNYSVLGSFTDRSGGTLGNRSTMSWDLVPQSWPTAIESCALEVAYPEKAVPLYAGVSSGEGTSKAAIEKTQDTAFTGKLDAFNVSEGEEGITMQPPSGIGAKAGIHILVALSKKDLRAAPKTLAAVKPAEHHTTASKPRSASPAAASPARAKAAPGEPSLLSILLPLLPPILFFFLYLKRFSFLRSNGFPTSAVPEGIGPAEAGYLVDGSLKSRHVVGALFQLSDGDLSKPGAATVDSESLGPVERRALEILRRRSTAADPKQMKTFLNGSLGDLQRAAVQSLASQDLIYPTAKRGRVWPGLSLLIALGLAGWVAISADQTRGLIFAGLGLILSLLLIVSLSPLTPKGANCHRKLLGLEKFLRANAGEFKSSDDAGYLEHLRPFAIALGYAKEERG